MRIVMSFRSVPRAFVRMGLTTARLPVSAAEAVLAGRRKGDWPPAVAFDGFEARVKQLVGGMLGDDALLEEGRLEEVKVQRLRQAADLETVAAQRKQEADIEFAQRQHDVTGRRRQAESEAEQRKAALDREAQAAKQKAVSAARRKSDAAKKSRAAAEKAIDRRDRRSQLENLAVEKKALGKQRAAATRARTAKTAEKRLRQSKAARAGR